MWMEETLGKRINEERTRQAVDTNAGAVVTNCPFCLTMIEDGLKEYDETPMKTYDVAELLEKYCKAKEDKDYRAVARRVGEGKD